MFEKLSDRICANPFDEQKEVIEKKKQKKRMRKALIHAAAAQEAARFTYVLVEPEVMHSSSDKSRQPHTRS